MLKVVSYRIETSLINRKEIEYQSYIHAIMTVYNLLENDVCYFMTYLSVAVVVNFTNINLRTSYIVFAIGNL